MKDTGDSSICEKADESRVESLLGLRRMGLKYFVVGVVPAFLGGFRGGLLRGGNGGSGIVILRYRI